MTEQAGLCRTWSEPKLLVFSRTGSNVIVGATATTTSSGVGFGFSTPASSSTGFGLSGGLKLGKIFWFTIQI